MEGALDGRWQENRKRSWGEIVPVASGRKFRDGGRGERRRTSGEQTALVRPGYQEVASSCPKSVIANLSVASSIKGWLQPQSSRVLLGTRALLGTESHWVLDSSVNTE